MRKAIVITLGMIIGVAGVLAICAHLADAARLALYAPEDDDDEDIYGWLDAETEEIVYNTNGMPDISANEMYHSATVSGTIDTIPETPGLAVWHEGHIGVYIGNGEVVEAMGTRYGVVKTKLEGARWTHWLKIPDISYD